jgi:hypothetical protein
MYELTGWHHRRRRGRIALNQAGLNPTYELDVPEHLRIGYGADSWW